MAYEIETGTVCITRTKCRRVPYGPNRRMHWGEKLRWNKAWAEEIFYRLRGSYPHLKIIERAIITLTFYTTSPQDYDNTVASAKPLIDGLKGWVIRDDDREHCTMHFNIEKAEHKSQEKVKIKIEPQP